MQYAVIPTEGDITFHEAEKIDLDVLYRAINTDLVEAVGLSRDGVAATAWLAEEGKLDGLPVNPRADWLMHMTSGIAPNDTIVGIVVVTGGYDDEGETLGLPEEWSRFVREDIPANAGQRETA